MAGIDLIGRKKTDPEELLREQAGLPGIDMGFTGVSTDVPGTQPWNTDTSMPGTGIAQDGNADAMNTGVYGRTDLSSLYDSYNTGRQAVSMDDAAKDFLAKAQSRFTQYKGDKAQLETRVRENEEWYRLYHSPIYAPDATGRMHRVQSKKKTAWLFNSIDNKHADFMDNFPDVTVNPRERTDELAAKQLTEIIPVILQRNNFKETFSSCCTDKLKNGTGIYYVTWDPDLEQGMGDICIERVDPLNIFWENGVNDIQNSEAVYVVELVNNSALIASYPEITDLKDRLSTPGLPIAKYYYNENQDTGDKSYKVTMYYKTGAASSSRLHMLQYVNDVILYWSERDPNYAERGWYDHGLYPFVFDSLYDEAGSPFGFGLLDIGRDTQEELDDLRYLMLKNAKVGLKRRWMYNSQAGLNMEELNDFDKDFIKINGPIDERIIREVEPVPMGAAYVQQYADLVNEMKEITSNRDVTAGGTGGTSTASGIAALQETGNKTSRAMISKSYNAFRKLCELVIELIRQFYDTPRAFRIIGENGAEFMDFSNAMIAGGQTVNEFGIDYQTKAPVFDLDVKTFKMNPYSRAAQNEDAVQFYQMGLFNPQNDVQAEAVLEMLDFEGKEKVAEIIKRNGQMSQFLQQTLPMLLNTFSMVDPAGAAMIAQQFGLQPTGMQGGAAPADAPEADMADTSATGEVKRNPATIVEKARNRAAASAAARG